MGLVTTQTPFLKSYIFLQDQTISWVIKLLAWVWEVAGFKFSRVKTKHAKVEQFLPSIWPSEVKRWWQKQNSPTDYSNPKESPTHYSNLKESPTHQSNLKESPID